MYIYAAKYKAKGHEAFIDVKEKKGVIRELIYRMLMLPLVVAHSMIYSGLSAFFEPVPTGDKKGAVV